MGDGEDRHETSVTSAVQGQKSDKDRGNGCFWSTRRFTNGEEEAVEVMSESVK